MNVSFGSNTGSSSSSSFCAPAPKFNFVGMAEDVVATPKSPVAASTASSSPVKAEFAVSSGTQYIAIAEFPVDIAPTKEQKKKKRGQVIEAVNKDLRMCVSKDCGDDIVLGPSDLQLAFSAEQDGDTQAINIFKIIGVGVNIVNITDINDVGVVVDNF